MRLTVSELVVVLTLRALPVTHPMCFSLSASQLVNEILEKFQAMVNYVLFRSSAVFALFTDAFSLFSKWFVLLFLHVYPYLQFSFIK